MKIKSVSGVTLVVKDLARSSKFYEALGFEIRKREAEHATAYSNWFWIDLRLAAKETRAEFKKDAAVSARGVGAFMYLSVDDVDAFHKELTDKGLKPAGDPQDRPWGDREFLLRDPDGYRLMIFKRK
jgi:catechol 2,3-dioxygenase-like lactoylglutathione lyase family enzyme